MPEQKEHPESSAHPNRSNPIIDHDHTLNSVGECHYCAYGAPVDVVGHVAHQDGTARVPNLDRIAGKMRSQFPCPGRSKGRKHRWRVTYFPHDPPFRQCKKCGQRQRLHLADPPDDYWYWLNLPNPSQSTSSCQETETP